MTALLHHDELLFADDDHDPLEQTPDSDSLRWKILIVDDEPEIHAVTKLALDGFEFAGRRLAFYSVHSSVEAIELVAEHPDAAMVLLDVVMENDHAGLDVAR